MPYQISDLTDIVWNASGMRMLSVSGGNEVKAIINGPRV